MSPDTEALKALVAEASKQQAIIDAHHADAVERAFEQERLQQVKRKIGDSWAALERLLASPDANRQEPVAWMYGRRPTAEHPYEHGQTWSLTRRYDLPGWIEIPLYAHPFPSHDAIMAAADEIGKLFQLRWGRRFEEPVMPQEIEAIIRKHLGKRGDK